MGGGGGGKGEQKNSFFSLQIFVSKNIPGVLKRKFNFLFLEGGGVGEFGALAFKSYRPDTLTAEANQIRCHIRNIY